LLKTNKFKQKIYLLNLFAGLIYKQQNLFIFYINSVNQTISMGNIVDKIANNKSELLSAATLFSVIGYLIYEAR